MDKKLKPCPSCGGEVELIKYYETCDGRGDKLPEIKCKCGLKMTLTFDEFYKVRDDFNYVGGYYSNNKELWNGMHQRLIDKWNTRKMLMTDNRFEIIGKAKKALLDSTNIEQSPDEMKVLNDFLFRCWQMGWLDKYENEVTK